MQDSFEIAKRIKAKAKDLGFLGCAIVQADILEEEIINLESWLSKDMYGKMGYMARNVEKRIDPRLLFEDAKSVVVVLQNYFPKETQADKHAPVISKYAYGKDYHFVIKKKIRPGW